MAGFLLFPRLAQRLRPQVLLIIAYGVLGFAVALNLVLSWQLPPGLYNVIPLFVYSIGVALAMPPLIARALEPFRSRSGIASSCHSFLQFAVTGVAAGVLAPVLWGSMWTLALGSGCLSATGAIALWWELRFGAADSIRAPEGPKQQGRIVEQG